MIAGNAENNRKQLYLYYTLYTAIKYNITVLSQKSICILGVRDKLECFSLFYHEHHDDISNLRINFLIWTNCLKLSQNQTGTLYRVQKKICSHQIVLYDRSAEIQYNSQISKVYAKLKRQLVASGDAIISQLDIKQPFKGIGQLFQPTSNVALQFCERRCRNLSTTVGPIIPYIVSDSGTVQRRLDRPLEQLRVQDGIALEFIEQSCLKLNTGEEFKQIWASDVLATAGDKVCTIFNGGFFYAGQGVGRGQTGHGLRICGWRLDCPPLFMAKMHGTANIQFNNQIIENFRK